MASWATRRKRTLRISFFLVFAVLLFGAYSFFGVSGPTCDDGIKNQDEVDIDCGGPCSRVCRSEASPLITLWSKVFKVAPGEYDAIALIENPNISFGIESEKYSFELYDANNILVLERGGSTYVNPKGQTVLYLGGLPVGSRVPTRAFVELDEPAWSRITAPLEKSPFVVSNKQFDQATHPSLTVDLSNTSLAALSDVEVYAVLSGDDGNAFAASETYVRRVEKGEKQSLVFTWPIKFDHAPAVIDIYPSIKQFTAR